MGDRNKNFEDWMNIELLNYENKIFSVSFFLGHPVLMSVLIIIFTVWIGKNIVFGFLPIELPSKLLFFAALIHND
jgi:hypothetical protein